MARTASYTVIQGDDFGGAVLEASRMVFAMVVREGLDRNTSSGVVAGTIMEATRNGKTNGDFTLNDIAIRWEHVGSNGMGIKIDVAYPEKQTKEILLTSGISIKLSDPRDDGTWRSGTVDSDFKEYVPLQVASAIEQMVLNHALVGVNVEDDCYQDGLEVTISSFWNID